jgi:hypothetical protein
LAWAIDKIDHRCHAFLCVGFDSVSGGSYKIAWPIVRVPKDHGGLGILNLRILGYALQLRWEWLCMTKLVSAWAALPTIPEHKVGSMFNSSVSVEVGDGTTTRLWTDVWLSDRAISKSATNLFKAVGWRCLGRTMKDTVTNRRWVCDNNGARML